MTGILWLRGIKGDMVCVRLAVRRGRERGETQYSEWKCKITEVGEGKQRDDGSIVARRRKATWHQRGLGWRQNIVKGGKEGLNTQGSE